MSNVVTDSDYIKQPHFNDLWVRLESSSFGPNSYLAQQNMQIQQEIHTTTPADAPATPQHTPEAATSSGAASQAYPRIVVLFIVLFSIIARR